MGVTGLWSILDELGEDKDFNYLSGKRVAIDLSGWVVQAFTTQGLNNINNPHIRHLFFRVRRLLQSNIHPIFVMDGQMPALKGAALMEKNKYGNLSRPVLDKCLQECHELLKSLGIPCFKASGEGEACCAFLNLKQKVDGVITEDGDALLYGADPVYRGFTNYNRSDKKDNISKHDLKVYSLKSKKNMLKLDRAKLIAIALLVGCGYGKGVPGIGKETALKFLDQDVDVFQRFKDWKEMNETQLFPGYDSKLKKQTHCKLCDHIGTTTRHKKEGCEVCDSKTTCHRDSKNPCSCAWHKSNEISLNHKAELKIYKTVKEMEDFPDFKIIDEYLNYTDEIPEQDTLEWKRPHQRDFQDLASHYLKWSTDFSRRYFLPIITLWQLNKLSKDCLVDQADFLYEPVEILKQRIVKGEACFNVQWKLKGQDSLEETVEFVDIFKKSYPKIAEAYYKDKDDKAKPKKVSKPMKRKEKVITKSTSTLNLENMNHHDHIKCVNESSCDNNLSDCVDESSDSFLELPLVERVRIMSNRAKKLQLKNTEKHLTLLKSPLVPGNLAKSKFDSIKYQQDDVHDSNICCLSNSVISFLCNGETNFSEFFDSASKPKLLSLYSKQLNESFQYSSSPCDKNKQLCLEFSGSDDSFQDIVCGQDEELCNLFSDYNRKYSILLDDDFHETSFVFNSSNRNHEKDNLNVIETESSFLESPKDLISSPKLIYSVNRIMTDADYIYTSFTSSSVLYSTPKIRPLMDFTSRKTLQLKSSKSSTVFEKKASDQIFSPVIFDSSNESIICLS